MTFRQTVKDLRALKIHGSNEVALAALRSLKEIIKETKSTDVARLKSNLERAKKTLFDARRAEPAMQNAVNYALHELDAKNAVSLTSKLDQRIEHATNYFSESKKKIVALGKQKIKKGMVVFIQGHSPTVVSILKAAKKEGIPFTVHNTEARPLQDGRRAASELAKAGIPVKHFADSATRLALRKADIMFMGAEGITTEGKVINTIGSELAAEIANRYDVPVYVCAIAWKLDPSPSFKFEGLLEKRHALEVWEKPPKQVTISSYAFEQVDPELVSGIITELGIYEPAVTVEEVKKKYSWIS